MNCPNCGTTMHVRSIEHGERDLPADWASRGGARANGQYAPRRRHCPSCETLLTTITAEVAAAATLEYVPGAQETYGGVSQPVVPRALPRRREPQVEGA